MNAQQELLQNSIDFQTRMQKGFEVMSEIGEIRVGMSAKTSVYSENKLVLYRYLPLPDIEPVGDPLIIVYALVNRPYIVDLYPERSLVQGLLNQGLDVYLIDWGYATAADRYLDLTDYVDGYINRCVDAVLNETGRSKVNVLGICQGGSMSLCYAALYPEKVKNLITMVTPVDFHTPENLLSNWFREIDADLLVDTMGNVSGVLLNSIFLSLKPFQLGIEKYLDFAKIVDQPEKVKNFMRMEKWIFDSPDQAGQMFRTFLKSFFHENRFVNGNLKIQGRQVRLHDLQQPLLNIMAKHDHLVPPSASKPLKYLAGSNDYTELVYDTGHIGIYVSGKAGGDIPVQISDWLRRRMTAD